MDGTQIYGNDPEFDIILDSSRQYVETRYTTSLMVNKSMISIISTVLDELMEIDQLIDSGNRTIRFYRPSQAITKLLFKIIIVFFIEMKLQCKISLVNIKTRYHFVYPNPLDI